MRIVENYVGGGEEGMKWLGGMARKEIEVLGRKGDVGDQKDVMYNSIARDLTN